MDCSKIKFIQKTLSRKEIFLVTNKSDIFYLTGKELDGVSLVITSYGEVYCLVSQMLVSQAKEIYKENNFFSNKNFVVGNNLLSQLKTLPVKFKTISVQKEINLFLYNLLIKNWSVKMKDLLNIFRQKKSEKEIDNIQKAINITKKVLFETKNILKVGITEKEVKRYILKKFLNYEVEPSFEPIVAFDENTSYPHHISGEKKFGVKSFILIDLGCKFGGYCSDITRMFFVNRNKVVNDYYKQMLELQKKLISMCVVGRKVSEIDFFAKKFCKNIGVEKNYLHSTGHGIGIDVHESPRISVNDKTVLSEGMVITIEPGIYFETNFCLPKSFNNEHNKKFGVRIEDIILVTKKGPKNLTITW